jgi:hypothetical protein
LYDDIWVPIIFSNSA